MNTVLIKICGIRKAESAIQAANSGADYIGLVFYPASNRNVNLIQAKTIVKTLKDHNTNNNTHTKPVAVFVDQNAAQMKMICEAADISIIQLHGSQAKQEHYLLPEHYQRIYVLDVYPNGDIKEDAESGLEHCDPERDFLLFDNETSGIGKTFDWKRFVYHKPFRWFLAGGLNKDNIRSAIQQLHPNGVDVSSGVESQPGEKDNFKIQQFIEVIHATNGDFK